MLNTGKLKKLPRSSQIGLRRSFGKGIDEADAADVISFYTVVPGDISRREEHDLFFAATMYCYYKDQADLGVEFSDAVSTYYKRSTESARENVLRLMDAPYDMNGTFFRRMVSLIKKMETNGIYVDANDMYQELKWWDSHSKQRKTEIAKKIVGMEEGEDK